MFKFAGVYINPYEICYCEIVERPQKRPQLVLSLTNGEHRFKSFDDIDEIHTLIGEIAESVNPFGE